MTRRAAGQSYPIRAVARLTGLSVDTLRAWERRYDAVVPQRGERGRVYHESDISRLKQLAALVERGHAIGTVAALPSAQLAKLLDGSDALTESRRDTVTVDPSPVMDALDRYDLAAIEATLARHAAVLPTRDLVFAVMLPLLRELGTRWAAGTLSTAQEHLVSAVVRSVLGGLLRAIGRTHATPRVVFATAAGERHELGLLCAAVLAASAGCGVLYLGPDLPANDIAEAVRTSGAAIVVIGATTPGAVTRSEARKVAKALTGVEVWIGGPQASSILADVAYAHRVESLEEMVTLLARRAR